MKEKMQTVSQDKKLIEIRIVDLHTKNSSAIYLDIEEAETLATYCRIYKQSRHLGHALQKVLQVHT